MAYYWCFYYITFAPVGSMTTMLGIARWTKGASSTDSVCNHTVASWAHSSLCHTHIRKRFSTRACICPRPARQPQLADRRSYRRNQSAKPRTIYTPVLAPKRCSLMHDCGHDARHTKGPTCGAVGYELPVRTLRKYCDPISRRSTYTQYTTPVRSSHPDAKSSVTQRNRTTNNNHGLYLRLSHVQQRWARS